MTEACNSYKNGLILCILTYDDSISDIIINYIMLALSFAIAFYFQYIQIYSFFKRR